MKESVVNHKLCEAKASEVTETDRVKGSSTSEFIRQRGL